MTMQRLQAGLAAIRRAIVAHQGEAPEARLLKLSEEIGEVAQAYIGHIGANKRKGVTHGREDVAKELVDVVITAMVALGDWTDNPLSLLLDNVDRVAERCREQGS